MAGLLPPLMPGWTEHVSPDGQLYWHNEPLQQSTYTRPTSQPAGFPVQYGYMPVYSGPPPPMSGGAPPPMQAGLAPPLQSQNGVASTSEGKKAKSKKEKPAKKEPIPGASGWLRVTTTLGNIFYTHVEDRRSEWTVPEEIREQVEQMDDEERRIKALEEEEERLAREEQNEQERRVKEEEKLEQMKIEQEERRKRQEELRLREEAVKRQREERERIQEERLKILQEQGKRKREQSVMESGVGSGGEEGEVEKRARLEDGQGEEDDDDDDEAAWQRQMAAEMAAEMEEGNEERPDVGGGKEESSPSKLRLSVEEGKTLFSHMLTGLNGTTNEINPMAPWDRELPKFVHHRDYTVLGSVRDRQDAFNEWCKLRLREKRNKGASSTREDDGVAKAEPKRKEVDGEQGSNVGEEDHLASYRSLLESQVQSTRSRWEDFKKTWKKDRRFFAFGRDDREREKVFRRWLKELGEQKREAAERGERDFLHLLQEHLGKEYRLEREASTEQVNSTWAKAKQSPGLYRDARYEAVGSSSRRAELYGEWARGVGGRRGGGEVDQEARQAGKERPDRSEQSALRDREEAVNRKRQQVEGDKRRAFGQATREESTTSFQQLLIDAIRDPLLSPSEAMRSMAGDGRFEAPGLRLADKESLTQQHIASLNHRRLASLHDVFARHAPSLDVEAEVALPLIKDDDEIDRRSLNQLQVLVAERRTMADLFEEWNQSREQKAALAFQQMLNENAFVNFWGRLRQEHEQRRKAASSTDARQGERTRQGEDEEDEDEPDLLQMAGKMDLEEVHSILRNDQRYRAFRHQPKQREEWIRHHLQTMSVPKQTVFQRD